MKKDLAYYRSLPYTKMVRVEEDDGGTYFVASVRELPGVEADGGSRVEALYRLQGAFDDYIAAMLEWGEEIPEPERWPTPAERSRLKKETSRGILRRKQRAAETQTAETSEWKNEGVEWDKASKEVEYA